MNLKASLNKDFWVCFVGVFLKESSVVGFLLGFVCLFFMLNCQI